MPARGGRGVNIVTFANFATPRKPRVRNSVRAWNSPLRGVARSRGVKFLPSLERRTLDRWNQNTPGTHASSFACVILRLIRVDPSTSPCLAQARSVRSEVCCQGSSCVVQICRNRRNRTIRTVRDYNDTRCGLAAAQSGTDIGETATLASGSLGFSLCVKLRQVSSSLVRSRQVSSGSVSD